VLLEHAEGRREVTCLSCRAPPSLAAASAWLVLGAMPHVTDEVSYTLQAKLFAAGLRTGPSTEPVNGGVSLLPDGRGWAAACA
jgi:hypothetical protein